MSKKQLSDSIPPHRHCPVCGKSIPLQMDYCSNKCRATALKKEKAERRNMMIMMVVMLGVMGILTLLMVIGRG